VDVTTDRAIWVGPSDDSQPTSLLQLLRDDGMVLEAVEGPSELKSAIERAEPRAILLSPGLANQGEVCLAVRTQARWAMIPVLWVRDELDDLAFGDAFGAGGDDVVASRNAAGLVRRIRILPAPLAHDTTKGRGVALLGDADDNRRVVLARLLRNAGFDVSFAVTTGDVDERVRADAPRLVVIARDLPGGDALASLVRWRAEGGKAPWVVATAPRDLREVSEALKGAEGAWVWDAYAPPENVLYAANEALRGSFAEQRQSPRLLFGTTVGFRVAGRDRDDEGFMYNVSGEGLFVRTLAPPVTGDDVWLEFVPPRSDRRVRLEASVVWRRVFGQGQEATVPPGFGVRITDGSRADRKRYREGYQSLAQQLAGIRFSELPSSTEG
jgi:DNA-binding response OmpR family regulator/Tfp pilus assembly protein PilZ